MKQVPNYITVARLVLVPIFVMLMVDPTPASRNMAIVIFLIAAATDFIDGILARRYGAVSDLGKMLDPLADKLLVMAALVMLVGQRDDMYGDPWVPAWMVCMVLAREIWITGMRGVAATRGVVVAASSSGKLKNFLQMVAICFLLLHDPRVDVLGLVLTCQVIGLYLLLFSILVSYWAAYEYTTEVFRIVGLIEIAPDKQLKEQEIEEQSGGWTPP